MGLHHARMTRQFSHFTAGMVKLRHATGVADSNARHVAPHGDGVRAGGLKMLDLQHANTHLRLPHRLG